MSGFTQHNRLILLATPKGADTFIVQSADIEEAMSTGFSIAIKVFSDTEHDLDVQEMLSKPITLGLKGYEDEIKHYNGYIRSAYAMGTSQTSTGLRSYYTFQVTSWLQMFAAERTNCRIFQDKSFKQVVEDLLKPYKAFLPSGGYEFALFKTHSPRNYWVQYNETDLAFLERLCRLEGIAYYYFHEDGKHTIKFVDSPSILPKLTPSQVEIHSGAASTDHLFSWKLGNQFKAAEYSQRAYNYKSPEQSLPVDTKAPGAIASTALSDRIESYQYSESHHDLSEGKRLLEHRANIALQRARIREGHGNCSFLRVGHSFQLKLVSADQDFIDKDKYFNLTRLHTKVSNDNDGFKCTLEATPDDALIYPEGETPYIQGLQTAVVTGGSGDTVYTDEFGRVKVQFHWDREGKNNAETTCWLRVMQGFAGDAFGMHFTPRVGHEVVVAFENGNPDRPFVLGSLYHSLHTPPYADNKGTRSGVRTRSIGSKTVSDSNELYFEDKKGNEELYVQAQKDLTMLVKNDHISKIENEKHQQVIKSETNKVGKDLTINVGKKLLIEAGSEIKLQVGGSSITLSNGKIDISGSLVDVNGLIKLN